MPLALPPSQPTGVAYAVMLRQAMREQYRLAKEAMAARDAKVPAKPHPGRSHAASKANGRGWRQTGRGTPPPTGFARVV